MLTIVTKPGQSSALQSRPDMVLYAITDCDWRLGSKSGESVDMHINAGESMFLEAVSRYRPQAGSEAVAVELKQVIAS